MPAVDSPLPERPTVTAPDPPLVRDERLVPCPALGSTSWSNRGTPSRHWISRPGPRSLCWWSATTVSSAAAGAWASTPKNLGPTWRRNVLRRNSESERAKPTPRSFSTGRTASAGASSAHPTKCPGSRIGRRTRKAGRPRQTGESRAAMSVRGSGVRAWPPRRSAVRSISSRAWVGGLRGYTMGPDGLGGRAERDVRCVSWSGPSVPDHSDVGVGVDHVGGGVVLGEEGQHRVGAAGT